MNRNLRIHSLRVAMETPLGATPQPTGMTEDAAGRDGATASPPPGPPALHGDNPTPPPLENGEGWSAEPLLVGGTDAYDDGEYCYQDHVYDDHGADTRPFLAPPAGEGLGGLYSQPTGDYCYPDAAERYGYNAADLLEFRAKPTDEGVAYRVTLNTMLEPDAAAVVVGVDTSGEGDPAAGRTDWGHGLGDLGAPVDHVLVTWGTGAALDGEALADDRVAVDVERNQLEVEVPLDPGRDSWRHYVGVGLWDAESESFLQVAEEADEDRPGGMPLGDARATPPLFNVGFRFDEPVETEPLTVGNVGRKLAALLTEQPRNVLGRAGASSGLLGGDALDLLPQVGPDDDAGPLGALAGGNPLRLLGDDASFRVLGRGNWREDRQARALAERDVSAFHADVDFGRLRDGDVDREVDLAGLQTLLYPSRYEFGAGVDPENNVLEGPIQPYAAHVPADYDGDPRGLTVLLPSLGGCYNQYPVYTRSFVESLAEDHGDVVLMPEARGPGRWFKREAEVDVFEAWRDLEGRLAVDRDRVAIAGYSMGGYGTLMYAAKYPDLFARAFAIGGPPSDDPLEGLTRGLVRTPSLVTEELFGGQGGGVVLSIFTGEPEDATRITDNLRHVPPLLWHGAVDPLVPALSPVNYADRLESLGYRHELDVFLHVEHLLLALSNDWEPGARFLASGARTTAPARVTYRHVPAFAHPDLDLTHDGAYWVSAVTAGEDADSALVDATSLGDGYGEPATEEFSGTGSEPQPHSRRGVEWTEPGTVRGPANALQVSLEGVASATLWVEEAGLDTDEVLEVVVESDGPATLELSGGFGSEAIEVPAGESVHEVGPLA